MNKVKIEEVNGKLMVFTPYCHYFVADAKKSGGKWDAVNNCWSFDSRSAGIVREILIDNYGTDGSPCELVSIIITAKNKIFGLRRSIEILGRTIARASGRDSGANVGEGVALIKGAIRSGGSVKNWETVIDSGTELIVHDMPKTIMDFEWDDWQIEIYDVKPSTIDRKTLENELQQINARAAQIKELLNAA